MTKVSNTKYYTFEGKVQWAKVYTPDEFRGAVRWGLDLYMDKDDEWKKFKESGIQKKVKENENGKGFNLTRSTTKVMKGKMVYFTPPQILDKDGKVLVRYVDEVGKDVRSYEDPNKVIRRVGDPVMIGNGSLIQVNVSVYPTAMGPGNRLEAIKIIDLIHYEKPEINEEDKEEVGPETQTETGKKINDSLPPW